MPTQLRPRWRITSLLILTFLVALGVQHYRQRKPALQLTILHNGLSSVETEYSHRIGMGLQNRFHVLLTNRGNNSVRLWEPTCGDGLNLISFEFKSSGDSEKVVTADNTQYGWARSSVESPFELLAGNSLIYDVDFLDMWRLPFEMKSEHSADLYMRAVYTSKQINGPALPASLSHFPEFNRDVWIGRVTSEWQKVTLTNYTDTTIPAFLDRETIVLDSKDDSP